jgi:hypothetical protein
LVRLEVPILNHDATRIVELVPGGGGGVHGPREYFHALRAGVEEHRHVLSWHTLAGLIAH